MTTFIPFAIAVAKYTLATGVGAAGLAGLQKLPTCSKKSSSSSIPLIDNYVPDKNFEECINIRKEILQNRELKDTELPGYTITNIENDTYQGVSINSENILNDFLCTADLLQTQPSEETGEEPLAKYELNCVCTPKDGSDPIDLKQQLLETGDRINAKFISPYAFKKISEVISYQDEIYLDLEVNTRQRLVDYLNRLALKQGIKQICQNLSTANEDILDFKVESQLPKILEFGKTACFGEVDGTDAYKFNLFENPDYLYLVRNEYYPPPPIEGGAMAGGAAAQTPPGSPERLQGFTTPNATSPEITVPRGNSSPKPTVPSGNGSPETKP